MLKVFVSSQRVDGDHASALIRSLRAAPFVVEHSPRNPVDGKDSRWTNWYYEELPAALDRAEIFVSVIDCGWDSATWMAWESSEAERRLLAGKLRMCYYNPEHIIVRAGGMKGYLKERLPDSLDQVIATLTED